MSPRWYRVHRPWRRFARAASRRDERSLRGLFRARGAWATPRTPSAGLTAPTGSATAICGPGWPGPVATPPPWTRALRGLRSWPWSLDACASAPAASGRSCSALRRAGRHYQRSLPGRRRHADRQAW